MEEIRKYKYNEFHIYEWYFLMIPKMKKFTWNKMLLNILGFIFSTSYQPWENFLMHLQLTMGKKLGCFKAFANT